MSPARRPADREVRGAAHPDLNDFPAAGEAGGKIINDFVNNFGLNFPPAGRPAEKNSNFFPKLLLLLLLEQQPAFRPAFFKYYY